MLEKTTKEATIKLVFRILQTVFLFDCFYLFSTIAEEFFLESDRSPITNFITKGILFDVVLILIQVLIIMIIFIRWYFLYYKIGETHITKKMGIFFKKDIILSYKNIQLVKYKQGILGKIFDYGDLVFDLVGTTFIMRNIESPQKIVEKIQQSKDGLKK